MTPLNARDSKKIFEKKSMRGRFSLSFA